MAVKTIADLTDLSYDDDVVQDGEVSGASFWNDDILDDIKTQVNNIIDVIEDEIGTDTTIGLRKRAADLESAVTTLQGYVDQDVSIDGGPSFTRVVLGTGQIGNAYAARQDFVTDITTPMDIRLSTAETDIDALEALTDQNVQTGASPTFESVTLSGTNTNPLFAATQQYVTDLFTGSTASWATEDEAKEGLEAAKLISPATMKWLGDIIQGIDGGNAASTFPAIGWTLDGGDASSTY